MKSLRQRLADIEARKPRDIVILAEDANGEKLRVTVKEFCRREDLGFVRVLSGTYASDLDRILEYLNALTFEGEGGDESEDT